MPSRHPSLSHQVCLPWHVLALVSRQRVELPAVMQLGAAEVRTLRSLCSCSPLLHLRLGASLCFCLEAFAAALVASWGLESPDLCFEWQARLLVASRDLCSAARCTPGVRLLGAPQICPISVPALAVFAAGLALDSSLVHLVSPSLVGYAGFSQQTLPPLQQPMARVQQGSTPGFLRAAFFAALGLEPASAPSLAAFAAGLALGLGLGWNAFTLSSE